MKAKLRDVVLPEVITALKFSVVGVTATILHLLVALFLMGYYDFYPVIANFGAFLCAFVVSFLGNFHWTFRVDTSQRVALVKFFSVTMIAFVINNLLLIVLLNVANLPKQWVVVIAAMVIPFVTFISSRLWVFK